MMPAFLAALCGLLLLVPLAVGDLVSSLPQTVSTFATMAGGDVGYSSAVFDASQRVLYTSVYSTGVVHRIAADGSAVALASSLYGPWGLVIEDKRGLHLFVVEHVARRVLRVSTLSGQWSVVCGTGVRGTSDGFCGTATFSDPYGVVRKRDGSLLVSQRNGYLRSIVLSDSPFVSTVASGLGYITAVALDAGENVYLTEYLEHCIKRIDAATNMVSVFAGSCGIGGGVDGKGTSARFYIPAGVTYYAAAKCFLVTEAGGCRLLVLTLSGDVTTLAGAYRECRFVDSRGQAARFGGLFGAVGINHFTNEIFVADGGNNRVRLLNGALPLWRATVSQTAQTSLSESESAASGSLSIALSSTPSLSTNTLTTSRRLTRLSISLETNTPSASHTQQQLCSATLTTALGSTQTSLPIRSGTVNGTVSTTHPLLPTSGTATTHLTSSTSDTSGFSAAHETSSASVSLAHTASHSHSFSQTVAALSETHSDDRRIGATAERWLMTAAISQYIGTGAQYTSVLTSSPSASTLARMALPAMMSWCSPYANADIAYRVPALFSLDEVDARIADSVAAVVGSIGVLYAVFAVHFAAAVLWSSRCNLPLRSGLLRVGLPSSLLIVWLATMPSAVTSALQIVAVTSVVGVPVLVSVFFIHCLPGFTLLAYVWVVVASRIEKRVVCDSDEQPGGAVCVSFLRSLMRHSYKWSVKQNLASDAAAQHAASCAFPWAAVVLEDHSVLWYPLLDAAVLFSASAAVGVGYWFQSCGSCQVVTLGVLVLFTVQFVVCACARPFSSDFSHVAFFVGQALVIVSCLLHCVNSFSSCGSMLWPFAGAFICDAMLSGVALARFALVDAPISLHAVRGFALEVWFGTSPLSSSAAQCPGGDKGTARREDTLHLQDDDISEAVTASELDLLTSAFDFATKERGTSLLLCEDYSHLPLYPCSDTRDACLQDDIMQDLRRYYV